MRVGGVREEGGGMYINKTERGRKEGGGWMYKNKTRGERAEGGRRGGCIKTRQRAEGEGGGDV